MALTNKNSNSKVGLTIQQRRDYLKSFKIDTIAPKAEKTIEDKISNPSKSENVSLFKGGNTFNRILGRTKNISQTPYKGAKSDAIENGIHPTAKVSDNYLLKLLEKVIGNENFHSQSSIRKAVQSKK